MAQPSVAGRPVIGWLENSRKGWLVLLASVAIIMLVLGGLALQRAPAPDQREEVGEVVLPRFSEAIPDLGLIMVTTSEESYHLVRNPDGWVLTEKDSYPVAIERITQLAEAMASMTYARPMTRDDRKFDRIGLGDPLTGGTGALVEVGDGRGNVFAKLIIGYRSGVTYVRESDDLQAWAVDVAGMPPLQRATRWLDTDIVDIDPADILEVEVQPNVGEAYALIATDASGQQFALTPPHEDLRVLVPFSLGLIGRALTAYSPTDVAADSEVAGAVPGGAHVTKTGDGLVVTATTWRTADRGWLTLQASTSLLASPDAIRRASEINRSAAGWAYALSENDWEAFTSPLALLAVEQ